jgi:aminoglycoside 6'-N-acetyltransferase I
MLIPAFPHADDWQEPGGALAEVERILEEGGAFVALEDDELLGWIGWLPMYDYVWELHPMVVKPDSQRRGVGRALVERLADAGREAGMLTLYAGSDDDDFLTTLSKVDDPYPNLPELLRALDNLDPANPHPFSFYLRLGFVVAGMVPHASGVGHPDIFLAKDLRK